MTPVRFRDELLAHAVAGIVVVVLLVVVVVVFVKWSL